MERSMNADRACYYVAALEIGATECRLAVQLLDASRKPFDSVKVYVQRLTELGEGYVSNIEVTSRVVAQVAGHMSKNLGFEVRKMAVIYMAGHTVTEVHAHTVRCTEQQPDTGSKYVTDKQLETMHDQALQWQASEEASTDWLVVYNSPVEYYTKDHGVKRVKTTPVGTFTDSIHGDYLGVKVGKEYANRFNAALKESGISVTNFYVEGLATPCVQKELQLRKGQDVYLHLGYTKSVLSEVFEGKNGELQLSHYAWFSGIGTEFSIEYAKEEPDCTQEYAYEVLQQVVRFDSVNLEASEFATMVEGGHFKDQRAAQITTSAMVLVGRLAFEIVKVLNTWYAKEQYSHRRFHIHLSGGVAGLRGIVPLMRRCFQLLDESRVERVELLSVAVSHEVVSSQSEGQVREESLCSVLGVIRQEMVRNEENAIKEPDVEKQGERALGEGAEGEVAPQEAEAQEEDSEGQEEKEQERFINRTRSFVKKIFQGPTKPIV